MFRPSNSPSRMVPQDSRPLSLSELGSPQQPPKVISGDASASNSSPITFPTAIHPINDNQPSIIEREAYTKLETSSNFNQYHRPSPPRPFTTLDDLQETIRKRLSESSSSQNSPKVSPHQKASASIKKSEYMRSPSNRHLANSAAWKEKESQLSKHYERKIKKLSYEFSREKNENERKLLLLENALRESQAQVITLNGKCNSLERERRLLFQEGQDNVKVLTEKETILDHSLNESRSKLSSMTRETTGLKESLSSLKLEYSNYKGAKEQEIVKLRKTNGLLEEELSLIRQQLSNLKKNYQHQEEENLRIKESQFILERKYRETKEQIKQETTIKAVRKELKDQADYIKSLEKNCRQLKEENGQFRSNYENVEMLREQKASLEQRFLQALNWQEKYNQLMAENVKLVYEKSQWELWLGESGTDQLKTPMSITKHLSDLKTSLQATQKQLAMANGERDRLQHQLDTLEDRISNLKSHNLEIEQELRNSKSQKIVLETSCKWLEKDMERLKSHLASYEMEAQMSNHKNTPDSNLKEEMLNLEKMLQIYKDDLEKLKLDLNNQENTGNIAIKKEDPIEESLAKLLQESNESRREQEQEIHSLNKENIQLKESMRVLEAQVEILEHILGEGDFSPSTTQVLQLTQNPEMEAFQATSKMIDLFKKENSRLLEQVKAMQEKISATQESYAPTKLEPAADLGLTTPSEVPVESFNLLKLENEKLNQSLEEKEKRLLRLKEVWSRKALEYRQAIFTLLGYRVDFQETHICLTSMFTDDNSYFLFGTQDDKNQDSALNPQDLRLIGAGNQEILNAFKNQVQFWLSERQCIPGFLSSVTLELMERLHLSGS